MDVQSEAESLGQLTHSVRVGSCRGSASWAELRGARDVFPQILFSNHFLHAAALGGSNEDFAGDVGGIGVCCETPFETLHV